MWCWFYMLLVNESKGEKEDFIMLYLEVEGESILTQLETKRVSWWKDWGSWIREWDWDWASEHTYESSLIQSEHWLIVSIVRWMPLVWDHELILDFGDHYYCCVSCVFNFVFVFILCRNCGDKVGEVRGRRRGMMTTCQWRLRSRFIG